MFCIIKVFRWSEKMFKSLLRVYCCLLLISLAACAHGTTLHQPDDAVHAGTAPLSRAAALAELDALSTPVGMDAEEFAGLKDSLRKMLESAPPERFIASPPQGQSNRIADLTSGIDDNGQAGIQWNYLNVGDYDLNGLVSISDITPIGIHFGKTSNAPDWKTAARFADGDGNGEINISDITPIGINFNSQVARYIVEAADSPEGPFSEIGDLEFAAGQSMLSGMRMYQFSPAAEMPSYRVVPVDGSGERGEPSNASVDFLISDRARIIGLPDGPSFVSRDGNDLVLNLPDGMVNPVSVGDVVVGEEQGGYLQRVTGMQQLGNQLVLETEPGILTDVFLQGGLTEALDDISQVPPEVYTINLSGQVLADEPTLRAEILEGSVVFLPQADVAINYNQYGGVTYLRGLVLGGPLDMSMLVQVEADDWVGDFPPTPQDLPFFEHKMTGFKFDFTAYQNGVPVTMSLQYDLYVGIRGSGELGGIYEARVDSSYSNIRMGGIFNSSGTEDVNEYSASHNTVPAPATTSENGDFSFTAYVRPEIHIRLYGNPIPGNTEDLALTLSPQVTWTAQRTATPFPGYDYELIGSMDTSYKLELHHIGMDEDTQFKLFPGMQDLLMQGFLRDFIPPG
jgi:hypothetical protein